MFLMSMVIVCFSSFCFAYDYGVSGMDSNGNSVSGDVEVDQGGGSGTIINEDGEEVEIDVEWTGNGELEGTDTEGNTYELETE